MLTKTLDVNILPPVIFLTGIDTDAGKTYMVAWLLREIERAGRTAISQKFIQTGCKDMSEDIEAHRRLLGKPLHPRDIDHTTAPLIFTYPASAQLAARIDGRDIDISLIDRSVDILRREFDHLIVEGAGGLMVPITDDFLTIDYISSRQMPVILVTNGVLGSINHTVLSLEAIAARNIKLTALVYNEHFDNPDDNLIPDDTRGFLQRYLSRHFPDTPMICVPSIGDDSLKI